jgi:IS30 family transposase
VSLEERVEIQQRVEAGGSIRTNAGTLGHSPSTISRERRRIAGTYRAQSLNGTPGRVDVSHAWRAS